MTLVYLCGALKWVFLFLFVQIIDRLWVNVLFVKQGRVCHCKVAINSCYSGSLIQVKCVK